jgi:hypothetical protein
MELCIHVQHKSRITQFSLHNCNTVLRALHAGDWLQFTYSRVGQNHKYPVHGISGWGSTIYTVIYCAYM